MKNLTKRSFFSTSTKTVPIKSDQGWMVRLRSDHWTKVRLGGVRRVGPRSDGRTEVGLVRPSDPHPGPWVSADYRLDNDDDDDITINTPNVLANVQLAKTVGEYMYTIQFLV